jgi:hypothetical protein
MGCTCMVDSRTTRQVANTFNHVAFKTNGLRIRRESPSWATGLTSVELASEMLGHLSRPLSDHTLEIANRRPEVRLLLETDTAFIALMKGLECANPKKLARSTVVFLLFRFPQDAMRVFPKI